MATPLAGGIEPMRQTNLYCYWRSAKIPEKIRGGGKRALASPFVLVIVARVADTPFLVSSQGCRAPRSVSEEGEAARMRRTALMSPSGLTAFGRSPWLAVEGKVEVSPP